jgi:hypothetical protein
MPNLKQHIAELQEVGKQISAVDVLARYLFLFFENHYVGKDNDHKGINGHEGFVDPDGGRMTLEEFFKAIETPEPPETRRRFSSDIASDRRALNARFRERREKRFDNRRRFVDPTEAALQNPIQGIAKPESPRPKSDPALLPSLPHSTQKRPDEKKDLRVS